MQKVTRPPASWLDAVPWRQALIAAFIAGFAAVAAWRGATLVYNEQIGVVHITNVTLDINGDGIADQLLRGDVLLGAPFGTTQLPETP